MSGTICISQLSFIFIAQWCITLTYTLNCFLFIKTIPEVSHGLFPGPTCKIKAMCLTFQCDCEVHKSEDQRLIGFESKHFFSHVFFLFFILFYNHPLVLFVFWGNTWKNIFFSFSFLLDGIAFEKSRLSFFNFVRRLASLLSPRCSIAVQGKLTE